MNTTVVAIESLQDNLIPNLTAKSKRVKRSAKAVAKKNISSAIIFVVLILLLIMVFLPVWVLIVMSFKNYDQQLESLINLAFPLYYKNYYFAWLFVKDYIVNSLINSVSITLGTILVCSMAAYAFARFKFPFKEALFIAMLALMMVPGILSLIAQYALVGQLGLIGTRLGVILPLISGGIPFGVFLLKTFFQGLPTELYEAADIDGASNLRKFVTMTLPLSMPILFTLGLTSFMGAWNDLIWSTLVLINNEELHTIAVGLIPFTDAYDPRLGVPLAGYVIVSLPLLIIFFFTSKQFIKGLTSGAFKM